MTVPTRRLKNGFYQEDYTWLLSHNYTENELIMDDNIHTLFYYQEEFTREEIKRLLSPRRRSSSIINESRKFIQTQVVSKDTIMELLFLRWNTDLIDEFILGEYGNYRRGGMYDTVSVEERLLLARNVSISTLRYSFDFYGYLRIMGIEASIARKFAIKLADYTIGIDYTHTYSHSYVKDQLRVIRKSPSLIVEKVEQLVELIRVVTPNLLYENHNES